MSNRQDTIFYNVDNRLIYDSAGQYKHNELLPYITTNELVEYIINLKNGADPDTWTDYTRLSSDLEVKATINKKSDYLWYVSGTLNAELSGAVTAIDATIANSPYVNPAGNLVLKNSAGETESVAYLSFSKAETIYTFVVDATLTNSYAATDVIKVEDVPVLQAISVDKTSITTGIIKVTFEAKSPRWYYDIDGLAEIDKPALELQFVNVDGNVELNMSFDIKCLNTRNNTSAAAAAYELPGVINVNPSLTILNAPDPLPTSFDCKNATLQDMADILGTILTQLKGQ